METNLLNDMVIVFLLSVAVFFICLRLRIPSIVGFLFAGIIIGPSALGFISNVHQVEVLAEIGVILLLFTIGLEFSLDWLLKIRKTVLGGGVFQVLVTIVVATLVAMHYGFTLNKAVFIGFLVALSSTAIVLKTLQEKAEIDSPHGSISLGILIFQDVIIVPMILITPLLAGVGGNLGISLLILIAKGIGIVLFVIIAARTIVPNLLFHIAKTKSPELFLLSVVSICFGVTWLTYMAGLSLALGAFLAGLIISETEYSNAALGNILPFKSVFATFFFISIGMMLDLNFLFAKPVFIVFLTLSIMFVKLVIAGSAALLIGYPVRTGVIVGCALCQLGEFSFILAKVGIDNSLVSADENQLLLSVAILSMAATPLLLHYAPAIASFVSRIPALKKYESRTLKSIDPKDMNLKGHLVIIGYGLVGRNVAKAAKKANIPYSIIEMNPETVKQEQKKGEPICYGDATNLGVLKKAGVNEARIVVIAINDPTATRRITEMVRRSCPSLYLIVRTRYVNEVKLLYELGASEVIPEEFETSVEIFARILAKYFIPETEIHKMVDEIRSTGYSMFRQLSDRRQPSLTDLRHHLHDVEISMMKVSGKSPLKGLMLSETDFRKKYGVSVVAILRNEILYSNPQADMKILEGDTLYLLGAHDQISDAFENIKNA